ncbi:MAG: hypothetical protein AAGH83_07820, partial [Pseudomonadota bacterium]
MERFASRTRFGTAGVLVALSLAVPALGQDALPDALPAEATRLQDAQIQALLGSGTTFTYVGAAGRATGTSTWNLTTKTAYGTVEWDKTLKGTWNLNWKVENDLSCLESNPDQWVCQQIFGYKDGFFEVDEHGVIHTHTTPMQADPLDAPLTVESAASMLIGFMKWAQYLDLTVQSSAEQDG